MTNQELFERAVAGNWIAESFTRPTVSDGVGKFYLGGSSKGYTNFGETIDDGSVVFYAAFDEACNREAGFATFNASDQSLTPIESTATLANDKYIDGDVAPIAFPDGGTITGTFNAVAFNAIWAHIWDKNNPHEVDAGQVEQDNENQLGDNVQDALDNLSGIIAEWDNAIKSTAQNYVQELPPPNPQKGDMWTDVGVTGEQYVWEGEYWVSVTGGGLGVDLDDLDSYSSKITTDVVDDDQLYDIPLERVISSSTGEGKWVAGGDGSGVTFVPEAPEDGLQYGRENGEWTEIDAGGVWDSDGIEDVDGNATGHYYHLSNAENTNIFKTTIGSDEVEMMGLTSIQAAQIDVRGNDKSARFQGAGDNNFLEVNFVEQYNEVQLNTNATYFNLAKNGQVGFTFDGSLEGNFLYACSIGKIRIDGEKIHGKGFNGGAGIGFFLSGATNEILPIDALGNELTTGPDFGSSTYRYKDGYFNGKVSAADYLDSEGNSIVQPPVDLSTYITTDPAEKPYSQYFNGPNQALEWQSSGAPYHVSIGQAMEGGIGMGFSPLYVGTNNGVYEINSFSFLITGGTIQGKKRRDPNSGEDVYSHIRGFASIQAEDFLDQDGNSIVQPPVDLTGYATEAYVGQQISAIPPPPVPESVTSATKLKGYEHGLVLGSSPGFGGNNLYILGSDANGAYNSRVMMGNGLSQQFSIMYAENFYKAGSPMLAAVDLIDTFTTIKSALTEEQTVEGLRTAVVSGLDAVIQKLQAMEEKAEEEGHKS